MDEMGLDRSGADVDDRKERERRGGMEWWEKRGGAGE